MKKLAPYYPILNNKEVSKCSHEFILDCSQIKKDTKIT
jgi:glycine cleavage system protein P-like pyridoxal-binding family